MAEEKNIEFNDATLHYSLSGKGNCVVLLHGFGEDASIWEGIADELSKNYQLIIPDIPGTGKSTLIQGSSIGMDDYADSINAILKNEGISQCTIIGHSMGGYITLAFANKYPDKIAALGLFHSSAFADDELKKETRKKAILFIRENGVEAFLKTSTPGLFADAEKNKAAIYQLLQKGKAFTAATLIQYYAAMIARPDRTAVLKTSRYPVLLIMGFHDKAVPFDHGLQQSHMPSMAHIHILRNSAHLGMIEEAEKSLLIFAHFLKSVYVL